MVNIYVGDPEKDQEDHFTVHKKLLCTKIPYFGKMFKGNFQEAATNTARFPEDSPKTFDLLLGWVYNGYLPPMTSTPDNDAESLHIPSWDALKLFALAEKFCISELMDITMDMYRKNDEENGTLPMFGAMEMAYEITDVGSALQKYMAMSCAYVLVNEDSWKVQDIWTLLKEDPGLNLDVMAIIRENRGIIGDPSLLPNCDFHSHLKDIPCPWKMEE